jgi:hypothetical protein
MRALRIEADNRNVLVDTSGENLSRHDARAPECDAVASDVKENVIWLENYVTKPVRLFVRNKRKPGAIEATVEDILASHKSEVCPTWKISV